MQHQAICAKDEVVLPNTSVLVHGAAMERDAESAVREAQAWEGGDSLQPRRQICVLRQTLFTL
jgi:hypothetical protein